MKIRIFIWLLILAASFGGLYAFETTRLPCRTALAYTIGQVDERFGIDRAAVHSLLREAEKPWEEAFGQELFQYDPAALFPVNLIFDERQERTLESQKLEHRYASTQKEQQSLQQEYEERLGVLQAEEARYTEREEAYLDKLEDYNERIRAWNEGDRTDGDELDDLHKEERELTREQAALNAKRQHINTLIGTINQYAKKEEQVVSRYNNELTDFTDTYGTGGAFDQGIYSGEGIDIFQFEDRDHLRLVLAHELGHALGLGHVEHPQSVMYPLMEEQDPEELALSSEDRNELARVCSVTAGMFLREDLQKVWQAIRGSA